MKVCVFGTRGFPDIQGGVETHCERLYSLIAADGRHEITVFRRKPFVNTSSKPVAGIRFIDLPSTRIKGFEALYHSFLATLKCLSMQTDVVHIHNIGPAIFSPLLKLFGKKVVMTYHTANYEHEKWNLFARLFLHACEKIALAAADRIIFVNCARMNTFGTAVRRKSFCIPNGINPAQLVAADGFLQSLKAESGKYVLAVGRLTPEKGFDYLIRAFEKSRLEGCKLIIAGGIDGEQAFGKTLQKLPETDRVIFTGFITGRPLQELYSNAGLFVLPSYHEAMPIVLLEAMSYGLPVLASDIAPNKAFNLPPQSYFTTGDINELSQSLQRAFKAPPQRICYPNLDEYDWRLIAKKTLDVYKIVIS